MFPGRLKVYKNSLILAGGSKIAYKSNYKSDYVAQANRKSGALRADGRKQTRGLNNPEVFFHNLANTIS